jgi:hypothetical protein
MQWLLLSILLGGCLAQAKAAVDPPATGGGTLTCRQIVEQCDSQCTNPMCLRACGNQGTAQAAAEHNALVDCGQRNNCTDEPCIRSACATEANTCQGPEPVEQPAEDPPAPLEPVVQ